MDNETLSSLKVLCIGDIMLDHYVYGTVKRQSPEAPIPILSYENENFQLGGVGNVARNISDIGANCTLLSILSFDKTSKKIRELISNEKRIKLIGINIRNYNAPIKTRYINKSKHLLRVDEENTNFKLKNKAKEKIANIIKINIKKCDVIILSDYNKGFLDKSVIKKIVKFAKQYNKLIIADPKKNDLSFYKNIDILTPNQKEISDSAGRALNTEQEIISYARKMIKKNNITEILVTRSHKGMLLIGSNYKTKIKANAKNVVDVTGAGDTVISVLGLMKGIGMNTINASTLANYAAGIIIG
ncbi:bifunctional ADP-heptose synthase, partial [Pelagibacteraceae bacterium]|nr:bifunctional ADP-heptose synthase [Pelagibacteraceae bacterium]